MVSSASKNWKLYTSAQPKCSFSFFPSRIWDIDRGACLRVLEGHSHSIWYVACWLYMWSQTPILLISCLFGGVVLWCTWDILWFIRYSRVGSSWRQHSLSLWPSSSYCSDQRVETWDFQYLASLLSSLSPDIFACLNYSTKHYYILPSYSFNNIYHTMVHGWIMLTWWPHSYVVHVFVLLVSHTLWPEVSVMSGWQSCVCNCSVFCVSSLMLISKCHGFL